MNFIKKNLKKFNLYLHNISYLLIIISSLLIISAILIHPYVSDDYHYQKIVNEYPLFLDYYFDRYNNWSGRTFQTIVSYFVYEYKNFEVLIQFLVFPFFFLTSYLIWYKILKFKKLSQSKYDFLVFLILFWFILPSPSETIVWLIGSITYIYPLLFGIIFLSIFVDLKNLFNSKFKFLTFIIIGFLAGSSHIQLSAGCFVVSSLFLINYYKNKQLNNKIFISNLVVYLFFLLGILILLIAPGNFNRLSALEDPNLVSQLYKSAIFFLSTIFYLGDIKSFLIFFLSTLFLLFFYSSKITFKSLTNKSNFPWLIGFIASIIIMLPMINFVSSRNIFFPIIFLLIYFLKTFSKNLKTNLNINLYSKIIVLFFLSSALFIDSSVNFFSNYQYNKENIQRTKIINKQIKENKEIILVPHYSIIPSRLTHIQTPEHDYEFLQSINRKHKFKHADNKPRSTNIYKTIKNLF
tara:strand:- start:1691 stop:3082 length:1392 start_codon:yes stop_codon:yes gene_type:complete